MVNINEYGFSIKTKSKKRQMFKIGKSIKILSELMPSLPGTDESYRAVSYQGGFASITFITVVALKEPIKELTVSTLRVGEKQFRILQRLHNQEKLGKVNFVIGSIMRENKNKYDYYTMFKNGCEHSNWNYAVVNNHSKLILMRTEENYYVLETSSNLNENPKIEQFTFENDKDLYYFYYNLLTELLQWGGGDG